MPSYVAFLRAINLGARRKFPKHAIRAAVEGAGFTGVETHISTGNVLLGTSMRSRARIESALEAAFAADRGFDVPTIVFTLPELAQVARDADELHAGRADVGRHYVSLLKDDPDPIAARALEELGSKGERVVVRGRAAHLMLGADYHTATIDNARVERLLGVATNRNHNVITTLAQKWT